MLCNRIFKLGRDILLSIYMRFVNFGGNSSQFKDFLCVYVR